MACRCCRIAICCSNTGLPIPGWILWFIPLVQRWRCDLGCSRRQPARIRYGFVRCCSFRKSCHTHKARSELILQLGPALGPITGGFIGLTSGWRWVSGFLAIFTGVIFFVLIIACSETYAPTLLRRRAAKMSEVTGKVYRFRADAKQPLEIKALFKTSLIRPWKFLM